MSISLRIDNDAQVWLDGTNVTANGTGGDSYNVTTGWWQHDGCADGSSPVFVIPNVPAGTHLLAIRGHDFGWATYLDVKADLAPPAP